MSRESLVSERIERRFLLPSESVVFFEADFTEFKEYFPSIDDGESKPVTRNIYFGRDGQLNKKGLIRVRQYKEHKEGDVLVMKPEDGVYLESKTEVDGTMRKFRIITSYTVALQSLENPGRFAEYFTKDETADIDPKAMELLLGEFSFLPLSPILAIQYKRRHFHPINDSLSVRVTLDEDIAYYAFMENEKYAARVMGLEGMSKMELKYGVECEVLALPVIERMINLGALPITTLQGKVEALYGETVKMLTLSPGLFNPKWQSESKSLHSLKEVPMFDELSGREVEVKLQVNPQEPARLMEAIVGVVKSGDISPFKLIDGKEEISLWTYFFDNYAYEKEGGLEEAFVIVRHPDKPRFFVKTKGEMQTVDIFGKPDNEVLAVSRPEEVVRIDRTYSPADAGVIVAIQQERLGKSVRFVGTNKRTKYYVFLYNTESGRYYNLAVDLCVQGNATMSQLELEYKGTRPGLLIDRASPGTIMEEMKVLTENFLSIEGFTLQPTTLRKFDWLKRSQGIR